jgi:hypothetical protein
MLLQNLDISRNLENAMWESRMQRRVARPVRRGLGGNVFREEQRAALPPYATQLLNAGCRVTSIQKFLGHKSLSTTMIYAHAHDKNVAEDYFAAMARVEQRFATVPEREPEPEDEVVNVPPNTQLLDWVERLVLPELCQEERLEIADSIKQALLLNIASQQAPPVVLAELVQ